MPFAWKRRITEFYIHSEGENKKAPNHSITELNWKKKQLLKHRENSNISFYFFFSLGTVTLSPLICSHFFLTGNICKTVAGLPVGGKYLFWKEKNPALPRLNLAAKVDSVQSEDKRSGPNTDLGLFWSFGLHSSPFHPHTARQLRPLLGTGTNFSAQPGYWGRFADREIFFQAVCWPV